MIARNEPGNPRPLRAVPDSGDDDGYTDWEAMYQDNAAWVGTDDTVEALGYLRRFASVTCINGHVHQLFSKTEGNPAGRRAPRRARHSRGQLHHGPGCAGIERTEAAMTLTNIMVRAGFAVSLIVSAAGHAYLYVHGYQHIPSIGTSFLIQASVSFALAVLISLGGPHWLRWAAAAIAGGSLVAFVASRTVRIFGFSETGWEPTPYAALSVGAEVLTVVVWVGLIANARRIKRGPSDETRLHRDRMLLDQEPAQRGQRQGG